MEYLQGGRENKIALIDEHIHRPSGFWSKSVHALLNHVRQKGFLAVPKPLGFDEDGNEVLTFLSGEVGNYPLSEAASSIEALTSAALLLRSYHEMTVSFLSEKQGEYSWLLPTQEPAEVICHGDFAPYNVVLNGNKAVGIIDFDTAHPAPRVWDIAYAVYRWAPLKNPKNPDSFGNLEAQIQRASLFCDTYDLSAEQRLNLVAVMIERLRGLIGFMHSEAQRGNEAFLANIADGHDLGYLDDIDYLHQNRATIDAGLHRNKAVGK